MFYYSVKTDTIEEEVIVEENLNKSLSEESPKESPRNVESIEETKQSPNKENLTPTRKSTANLNMSGTLIVSFSPMATPSVASETYGTPKSALSEVNDTSFESLDSTLVDRNTSNSSMYLIDLTTPAPAKKDNIKSLAAPKSSAKKNLPGTSKTVMESGALFDLSTPKASTRKATLLRSALKNSAKNLLHSSTKKRLVLTKSDEKLEIQSDGNTTPKAVGRVSPASAKVTGIKRLLRSPGRAPVNDYTKNVSAIKRLMRTPAREPLNDLSDFDGVEEMMQTPVNINKKERNNYTPNGTAIPRLIRTPVPDNDLCESDGGKELMDTSKQTRKTRHSSVNDLTQNGSAIKRLMRTPASPPLNDLSDVEGVQDLLKTPHEPKVMERRSTSDSTPGMSAVKRVMRTPINPPINEEDFNELMQTPNVSQSMLSDSTQGISAVKRMMRTPARTPSNNLSVVAKVIDQMQTPEQVPKKAGSPINDLTKNVTGVKRLLRTPARQHRNDLSDVEGVKELMQTPKRNQGWYN